MSSSTDKKFWQSKKFLGFAATVISALIAFAAGLQAGQPVYGLELSLIISVLGGAYVWIQGNIDNTAAQAALPPPPAAIIQLPPPVAPAIGPTFIPPGVGIAALQVQAHVVPPAVPPTP